MTQLLNNNQKVRDQIKRLEQNQVTTTTKSTNSITQITPRQVHRGRWRDDDEFVDESIQGHNKQYNNFRSVKMKIPTFHNISDHVDT